MKLKEGIPHALRNSLYMNSPEDSENEEEDQHIEFKKPRRISKEEEVTRT